MVGKSVPVVRGVAGRQKAQIRIELEGGNLGR